jgi:hypothetical protein
MREKGQAFFFLPLFGFADPEAIPALPDDYGRAGMSIHNLFPPVNPLAGNGATSDTNVPGDGRGVVYLHRGVAHLQLRSLDDIAREHGVEAQPSVDLYAQFRPEPSLWQRIKAMREDVPEAVRLVIGDIRAAP